MALSESWSGLKLLVRRAFNHLGFDVWRFQAAHTEYAALRRMLSAHRIDLVVDVGANSGQYGKLIRSLGYRGAILSLEPLEEVRQKLVEAARNDPAWMVGPAVALGAASGEASLNVALNSVSSSLRPMLGAHIRAAPDSRYIREDKVPVRRLDDVVGSLGGVGSRLLIKIDTQGYELEVLRGSTGLLPSVAAVQVELSLTPMYGGQPLIEDILSYMRENGFVPYSFWPVFSDRADGRLLQCDGLFIHEADAAPATAQS